jgi:hypothetical protein
MFRLEALCSADLTDIVNSGSFLVDVELAESLADDVVLYFMFPFEEETTL